MITIIILLAIAAAVVISVIMCAEEAPEHKEEGVNEILGGNRE